MTRQIPVPGPREGREWNAGVYHRISNPQRDWGLSVLDRLPLRGDELILDIGCGTGRLTEQLAARLPHGRVVCVDQSSNMLRTAEAHLSPRFGHQVVFACADGSRLPFSGVADGIFSTATFHWILDHDRLFVGLLKALKPGGRLVAQCGGGPNLQRLHDRCARLMRDPVFAPHFAAWTDPWEFADAGTTTRRLENAGFVDVRTAVYPSPVLQPDASAYSEFVEHVICRPHLQHLEDPALRTRFLARLTDDAARDFPPFELDYWRLDLDARRPLLESDGCCATVTER